MLLIIRFSPSNIVPPRNLSMEITPDEVILEGRKLNVACKSTTTDDKTFIYGEIFLLI